LLRRTLLHSAIPCLPSFYVIQNSDMYGQSVGEIKPEHLTNEVWDYIFLQG
jgi:hypothetical protein